MTGVYTISMENGDFPFV